MDFGILPPEVNSGRMYSGPGPGPVLAAATAWAGLAVELELVAGSYQSVINDLATGWAGPSATAMVAAAMPYLAWLHSAAAVAEQTATQTHAAAAAFEAAFAMTVPPPVIAANRSLLLSLMATNFFGQNLLAIAATEAAYAEMWAQDAAAMYGYAGAAADATVLTPFSAPPEAANPAGAADQAAAVGHAAGTATAAKTQQVLAKLPSTMQALASPAPGVSPSGPLGGIPPPVADLPTASLIELGLIPVHIGLDLFGAVVIDGLGAFVIDGPGAVGSTVLKEMLVGAGTPFPWIGSPVPGATTVSASMGQAVPLSGLSVPAAWAATAGEPGPITAGGPASTARAASVVLTARGQRSLNDMAMAGAAGLGVTAGLSNDRPGPGATTGRRIGSAQVPHSAQLEIAAEFRQLADLHDAGILTEKEFGTEKSRLFGD